MKAQNIFLDENTGGKGRYFKARILQPGLVKYSFGVCLLEKETIDKFVNDFVGCPVIIGHQDVTNQNADKLSRGNICHVWYDDKDGWYWVDGIIDNQEALNKIDEGYSVSCQYEITEYSNNTDNKLHNGNPYDKVILNGKPEHLAIVETPRYESAMIAVNAIDMTAENETETEENIEWITVNGSHIPIPKGSNDSEKEKAIEIYFESKKIKEKHADYFKDKTIKTWKKEQDFIYPIFEGVSKKESRYNFQVYLQNNDEDYQKKQQEAREQYKAKEEEKKQSAEKTKEDFLKSIKDYSPSFQRYLINKNYPTYREGGYSGFSRSNRANQAELEGRMPKTKAAKELGIKTKDIEDVLERSEWHHTSSKYNETDFYDIIPYKMLQEGASEDELKKYADERGEDEGIIAKWQENYKKLKIKKAQNALCLILERAGYKVEPARSPDIRSKNATRYQDVLLNMKSINDNFQEVNIAETITKAINELKDTDMFKSLFRKKEQEMNKDEMKQIFAECLQEVLIARNEEDEEKEEAVENEDEELEEELKVEEKAKNKKCKNEDVDKREIIRQIMAIAGKEETSEDVKTIAKLAEKLAYDKSEAGTADNGKKAKCEDEEEDKEEAKNKAKNAIDDLKGLFASAGVAKSASKYVTQSDAIELGNQLF